MKILYGVQGTGNGHLTRARCMARAFARHPDIHVDWLFSGRERSGFFDMDAFGAFECRRGMTLITRKGRVRMLKTLLKSDLGQLMRDARSLDMSAYDLVISDFEPVSAWAARFSKVRSLGISHQSAFLHPIPKRASNLLTDAFMRLFAPVDQPVGVHWDHFDRPLLPPIVEPSSHPVSVTPGRIMVYLPFADIDDITRLLAPFTDREFYVYHKLDGPEDRGHIHLRPFSRQGFQHHLHSCEGVICSAGFELPSETLGLGKKLLVEPVVGQMEQQSNALALEQLGLARATRKIRPEVIAEWLREPAPAPIRYPDVAGALADWIVDEQARDLPALCEQLWREVPGARPFPAGRTALAALRQT